MKNPPANVIEPVIPDEKENPHAMRILLIHLCRLVLF